MSARGSVLSTRASAGRGELIGVGRCRSCPVRRPSTLPQFERDERRDHREDQDIQVSEAFRHRTPPRGTGPLGYAAVLPTTHRTRPSPPLGIRKGNVVYDICWRG